MLNNKKSNIDAPLEISIHAGPRLRAKAPAELKLAFERNNSDGLLLILDQVQWLNHPQIAYWYEFTNCFMRAFALHITQQDSWPSTSPHLSQEQTQNFHKHAPHMTGISRLSPQLLKHLWQDLYLYLQSSAPAEDPNNLLRLKFPLWAQVGRLHFHLAEYPDGPKPFAFLASYSTRVNNHSRLQHVALASILEKPDTLKQILPPLEQAANQAPQLESWIRNGQVYQSLPLDPQEAYQFLEETPAYERAGIIVRFPQEWHGRPKRLKLTLSPEKAEPGNSKLGIHSLFQFNAFLSCDGSSPADVNLSALNQAQLVQISGQWVAADPSKLRALLHNWQPALGLTGSGQLTFAQALRLLSGVSVNEAAITPDISRNISFQCEGELAKQLRRLSEPETINAPDAEIILKQELKAELRPYQLAGVKWLLSVTELGFGACLADDMGLGKTLQVLAFLLCRSSSSPYLLLAPASLLGNWERELKRFTPSISYKILHPAFNKQDLSINPSKQLLLSSYGMASRLSCIQEKHWAGLILDEAQQLKNPSTQLYYCINKIRRETTIALSGTPIENHLGDLWALFQLLVPELLGSQRGFQKLTAQLQQQGSYLPLQNLIKPFMLRRYKSDVLSDLPPKTEVSINCQLTKPQITMYRQTLKELSASLKQRQDDKRSSLVLGYLSKFKQICNHPSQFSGDGAYHPQNSGKFQALLTLGRRIAAQGDGKLIVFTQFRELCDILAAQLAPCLERKGLILHGGTPVKQRQEIVEQFQKNPDIGFCILSLKAGGTGLNLTQAKYVCHFDRWWNPAIEQQATDRAHRLGQKQAVMVYKLTCQGTIEEKIASMLQEKRDLAQQLEGKGSLQKLSDQELIDLFTLKPQIEEETAHV